MPNTPLVLMSLLANGAAIHAVGKPKLKITIPLVANIAVIRQRVKVS